MKKLSEQFEEILRRTPIKTEELRNLVLENLLLVVKERDVVILGMIPAEPDIKDYHFTDGMNHYAVTNAIIMTKKEIKKRQNKTL